VRGACLHTDRVQSKQVRANPTVQVQNSTAKGKLQPTCFEQDFVEKEVAPEKGKNVGAPCTQETTMLNIQLLYPDLSVGEDRLHRFFFAMNIHQFYSLQIF